MRIIGVCALICAVIFRFVGEKTYQADIQTIQRYMVEPALWIKNNTPENSVVATHDIGAMGYFGKRKILDLAGLIQPEVIPIIRDEQGIKRYLVEKKADYLVAFRDWYPELNNYGRLLAQFELPNQTGHEVVEIRILNTTTGK